MYTSIHRTSQLPADCAQITYTFRSIFFSYFFPSSDEAVISAEVSTYISYWKRHHEILIRQEVTLCESLTKLGYTPSFKFFTDAEDGILEEYSSDSGAESSAPNDSLHTRNANDDPMTLRDFESRKANIQYDTEYLAESDTGSNVDWKEEVVEKPIDVDLMVRLTKLSK